MTGRARGSFEVQLQPLETYDTEATSPLGRRSIDKQFHGDLEASSKGEMLSAITGVQGSAGYVAIERVQGTLHGRRGTFMLQHTGTMTRGASSLTISVIPDSGTDELVGLAGTMALIIVDEAHEYDFTYSLPETT
jgi:hypothetical protein